MTAKFSKVFDDEIIESKKRVGCIGGIFQLFDCQQLLGQGHRRDASGNRRPDFSSSFSSEKNKIRRYQENQRDSMESSRTSFSSSFTTFSSIEHKSPQEQIYTHQSFFSKSLRNSPRSPAFKDIIKESIHKDFQSELIINEDNNKINRVMNRSKLNAIDESLKILFKLKESPRFSYDGSEISKASIDVKQTSKHIELSRLSLDGKEDSPRCNLNPKFNSALEKLGNSNNRRASAALIKLQDMEINQRHPSIVAKLMGLETLDERKLEKPLQSPRNSANMKQQIESLMEERLKKVENLYSRNELHDLKHAIIETKKKGNTKLNSVNSLSVQLTPQKHKLNNVRISEGGPIVIIEPATNFDFSFSEVTELENQTDLGNIRTRSSSNRKNDLLYAQINTISPRLQQIKSGMKKKATASIPTSDSNKTQRLVNSQTSDLVSPRCKLRQKPSKVQDIELQNLSDQVNVEAYRDKRSSEQESLFKKSIRSPTTKVGTRKFVREDKLKDLSTKEHQIALLPWLPSPNSVVDTLLKQDGLPHSPAPVSNVLEEYQDLPSDRSFNKKSLPHTHLSSLSSRNNLQKQDSIENNFHRARIFGRTNEDFNASNEYTSEIPQKNGILNKQSGLLSTLDPINSNSQSKFVEKSNPKKLHQMLISDVVNEILERKIVAFGYHDYQIKCHQICKEGKDENSLIHKKLLRKSQVWDSFKSEVPVIVLEIEKLIFKDLIIEVVNSETAVVLKTKQKQLKKQLLARNEI